jgi:hypothetical protein
VNLLDLFTQQDGARYESQPYCIDVSPRSLGLLLWLLRFALQSSRQSQTRASSGEGRECKGAELEEGPEGIDSPALRPDDDDDDDDGMGHGHAHPLRDAHGRWAPLTSWTVLWCGLRILRANIRALVIAHLITRQGTPRSLPGRGERPNAQASDEGLTGDALDLPLHPTPLDPEEQSPRMQQAILESLDNGRAGGLTDAGPRETLQAIHAMLLEVFDGRLALGQQQRERAALRSVQAEAAAVLDTGFLLFYPTTEARVGLLQSLVELRAPHPILFPVLSQNLTRDEIMALVVSPGDGDGGGDGAATPLAHQQTIAELLEALLQRCAGSLSRHLLAVGQPSGPLRQMAGTDSNCIKLLISLQLHLINAWVAGRAGPGSDNIINPEVEAMEASVHRSVSRVIQEARTAVGACREAGVALHALPFSENLFVARLLPALFSCLHAVPPHLAYSLTAHVPGLLDLAAALKTPPLPPGRTHSPGDAPPGWWRDVQASLAMLLGRLASDLAKCPPLAPEEVELAPYLASSTLFAHRGPRHWPLAAEDKDADKSTPKAAGVFAALLATRAWRAQGVYRVGEDDDDDGARGGIPEAGEDGDDPTPSATGANGSWRQHKGRGLQSLPGQGPPCPHSPSPSGRPGGGPPLRRSLSGRVLENVVETSELETFLQDLVHARGQAKDLDRALRLSLEVDPGPSGAELRGQASLRLLQRKPSEGGVGSGLGSAEDSFPSRLKPNEELDVLRRVIIAILLKSHGATQQASTLARCQPPVTASRVSLTSTTQSPLLAAIWRTAAGICKCLQELRVFYSPGQGDDCAKHSGDVACVTANVNFLLMASSLPPISLLKEDATLLLQRRVRKWMRSNPRADPKALQSLLAILQSWRQQFEEQREVIKTILNQDFIS